MFICVTGNATAMRQMCDGRATDGLGGGQIVITLNAATNAATKTKSFDKIVLPKLSAVGKLVSN